MLAAIYDVAAEFLAEIAIGRVRLGVVALKSNCRIDDPGQRQNSDGDEQDATPVGRICHGKLHPVLSLRACKESTPSLGGSDPNCQLGNSLTPAALHSGAISREPLIAHS